MHFKYLMVLVSLNCLSLVGDLPEKLELPFSQKGLEEVWVYEESQEMPDNVKEAILRLDHHDLLKAAAEDYSLNFASWAGEDYKELLKKSKYSSWLDYLSLTRVVGFSLNNSTLQNIYPEFDNVHPDFLATLTSVGLYTTVHVTKRVQRERARVKMARLINEVGDYHSQGYRGLPDHLWNTYTEGESTREFNRDIRQKPFSTLKKIFTNNDIADAAVEQGILF